MVGQFFLFSKALVHTFCLLLEVFGRWVKIALQYAVKGAVVMSRQGTALLENLHGPREIDLGPTWWWRDVFNDLDAVLKSCPVSVIVSVRALEPANEVAIVEIET